MSDFTVIFNGIDLSPYLRVTEGLERNIGVPRTNNTLKVGNSNFRRYTGYSFEAKTIEMPFQLRCDLVEKRRELAKILNVSEPVPLIFSDEPDKYYLAVPSGDINVSETRFLGSGVITWEIPNGVSYSIEQKKETNEKSDTISLFNSGTYKAFPEIEVTMSSENGFMGFINKEGSLLQFGNPDEVDGVTVDASEYCVIDVCGVNFNDTVFDKHGWKVNTGTVLPFKGQKCTQSGGGFRYQKYVLDYKPWVGKTFYNFNPVNYGDINEKAWHGTSMTRAITTDTEGVETAANWTFDFQQYFITGLAHQMGMQQWLVNTPNGENVAGYVFYKNSPSVNNLVCALVVNGKVVKEITNYAGIDNNLTGWDAGAWRIEKFENKFTFVTPVGTYSYSDSVAGGKAAKFITYYTAQWQNKERLTISFFTSCRFLKHNVKKWQDIPNKFGEYDVLTIDTKSGKVLLNGLDNQALGALGNDWENFSLAPGENEILCLYSEFSKKPTVKISFSEVFL